MTRFIIDKGYYIDSKKGGRGYIQITKIDLDKYKYTKFLINEKQEIKQLMRLLKKL